MKFGHVTLNNYTDIQTDGIYLFILRYGHLLVLGVSLNARLDVSLIATVIVALSVLC